MESWREQLYHSELYHHGIKGQKWGVRRYQNPDGTLTEAGKKKIQKQVDRVNLLYNRSNMWANRKAKILDKKGKTIKADLQRSIIKKNNKDRNRIVKNIMKMNYTDLKKAKNQDFRDMFFGGQDWMSKNQVTMTSFFTRDKEYQVQRGARWMSNFTLESTLKRLDNNKERELYLRNKYKQFRAYQKGANSRNYN